MEKRSAKLRIVKEDVWLFVMLIIMAIFVGGIFGYAIRIWGEL